MTPDSSREAYEAAHATWLAAWAVGDGDLTQRRYPEPPHAYRTAFQRDRDRVMHSAAFRRLDYKTQVFVPHVQDHTRTRLTHTLEVAQVARDVGRALRLNEDLIEAIALAHDLGHPPFGHAGEAALDELMAGAGGFEHNRQSLRVVDYLEHPYPEFRGLNLTLGVRECLARHETSQAMSSVAEFDPRMAGPLEGQLVDQADALAYTSADLDDALTAGWINLADLADQPLWQRAWAIAERASADARPIHKQIRAAKTVLALLADGLIEQTGANLASAGVGSLADVRAAGRCLVGLAEPLAGEFVALKAFLLERVYYHDWALEQDKRARQVIGHLFNSYVTRPELLPERYRLRVEQQGLQRVVCDYIAGMTDRFALAEQARLAGGA